MPIIGRFLSSGDSRTDNGQEAVAVAQPLGVFYIDIDLVAPCEAPYYYNVGWKQGSPTLRILVHHYMHITNGLSQLHIDACPHTLGRLRLPPCDFSVRLRLPQP